MAQKTYFGRGREGGITFPAFAASERGEAPGPGAERDAQVGIAGAGSPAGAASKKKGGALETVRCPLCGKVVRRSSVHEHAFLHFQRLEQIGVLRLSRENGGWVVEAAAVRYYGIGWRTLCAVAELLSPKAR
jgi:hypothetical protein